MQNLRRRYLPRSIALCAAWSLGACVGDVDESDEEIQEPSVSAIRWSQGPDQESIDRGRDIWFERTFGGEQFFAWLATQAPPDRRVEVGFEAVINTPRSERFDTWGVINDPDCTADPAGGPDLCTDPNATGIVGIRKSQPAGPQGPTLYGISCASCHAGIDPVHPPADPSEPSWDNIHATIGNMYLKTGRIFSVNLDLMDPRRPMFEAWPDGTVDTTLLFSDGIMNPGAITAIWEQDDRPTFHVHYSVDGGATTIAGDKLRSGQGGEDDIGGDIAALRVYSNIGACFAGCVAPALATGGEVDIPTCEAACEASGEWPTAQDREDLTAFLASFEAPQYPGHPKKLLAYVVGAFSFKKNCSHCHDNSSSWDAREVLSDDEITLFFNDPNVTNTCRARTSNWEEDEIWGQFSSDEYRARAALGDKGYRTMPLAGIWSTSPFTHSNTIGEVAAATATPAERSVAFRNSMHELMSYRDLYMNVLEDPLYTVDEDGNPVLLAPAGTPHHYVYSAGKCIDLHENRGHYFGAELPNWQKNALIYYLRYQ